MMRRAHAQPVLALLAAIAGLALMIGPTARAATYTVNVTGGLDLGSVAAAAAGDTVFRANPATGATTVQSGGGRRLSTTSVRAQVTVTCKPARSADEKCKDDNVAIRIGTLGLVTGRARALTNFSLAAGTATILGAPTGANPLSATLAPLGNSTSKTFFIGADFPVAGDDSGLATGNGENSFYVYVVDALGLPFASDTDKGKVKAFRALSVNKTADLSFGSIQLPSSGSSTVTLNASTGVRTLTGTAFAYPTPSPTRAAFTASGEGGQQFSLSIPTSLNLVGPATLPVTVTSTAPPAPSLSGGLGAVGSYSFTLGGSFTITTTTPAGAYSGTLVVGVDYN